MKTAENLKDDIDSLIALVESSGKTASKNSHYDDLDPWRKPIYAHLRNILDEYGFENGEKDINDEVTFWWQIYNYFSNIIYSQYIQTDGPVHHASAFSRNAAFLEELKDFRCFVDNSKMLVCKYCGQRANLNYRDCLHFVGIIDCENDDCASPGVSADTLRGAIESWNLCNTK